MFWVYLYNNRLLYYHGLSKHHFPCILSKMTMDMFQCFILPSIQQVLSNVHNKVGISMFLFHEHFVKCFTYFDINTSYLLFIWTTLEKHSFEVTSF